MRIGVNFASVNSINDLNSGIGLFIKQLIDGLIENNAKELVILTSRKMHDYISSLYKYNNIQFEIVPAICEEMPIISKLSREFYFLPKILEQLHLDVYIVPYTKVSTATCAEAQNVLVVHDLPFNWHPEAFSCLRRNIMKKRIGYSLSKADAIVAISKFVKEDIKNTYKDIKEERLHVIGNPVEVSAIPEHVKKRKIILSVNSFFPWKNQITLVKAFDRLKDKIEHDLVLIGYGDSTVLKQYIQERGLDNRIKILQHISDEELYKYYSMAELFVNTSMFEGFGRGNIEAGLMKVPVLSSEEMCLKDVSFGLLRYYAPADDADALAKAIEHYFENPASKEELDATAEKFASEYSSSHIASEYLKIINGLYNSRLSSDE